MWKFFQITYNENQFYKLFQNSSAMFSSNPDVGHYVWIELGVSALNILCLVHLYLTMNRKTFVKWVELIILLNNVYNLVFILKNMCFLQHIQGQTRSSTGQKEFFECLKLSLFFFSNPCLDGFQCTLLTTSNSQIKHLQGHHFWYKLLFSTELFKRIIHLSSAGKTTHGTVKTWSL